MSRPAASEDSMPDTLRILVADDDQAMVWLWARILQWGFNAEVVAVFDGNTALARIAEQRFDLVITDLQMPGASGLDVLRATAIRDPQIPVVLCTGHAPEHVVAEACRLGARVIEKPFDIDGAVALARELLKGRAGPGPRTVRHVAHCH
jgi:DNA-binding NtrC family response regulator